MYEVLNFYKQGIDSSKILEKLDLKEKNYYTVSAHREENINDQSNFKGLVDSLNVVAQKYDLPVIVSTHPRTRKMIDYAKTIAESNSFIVLDKYSKEWEVAESYQSEDALEQELIQDLQNQGYEYLPGLNNPQALLANVREQLQTLNSVVFLEGEWRRFVETYLDKPSDTIVDKTRKIHDDYIHDFVFDDGHIQNIYLLDKNTITRNKVQVIKQFEQVGSHANRYDVTILVNGLPLVQIELKKRGRSANTSTRPWYRVSGPLQALLSGPLLRTHWVYELQPYTVPGSDA